MRTVCLVNHRDYGKYVGEAVDSVLAQTRPLDEIVVVDDGSDPEHLARARSAAGGDPRIVLFEQPNRGQLSCFQVGLDRSSAELVFFLDADDLWEPGYVESVVGVFEARPEVDFVATNVRRTFVDGDDQVDELPSRDLGFSVVRSLEEGSSWVGAETSALAMRRSVLERIFPVPDPDAYRISADQVLVYGSSVAGAHKYFLGEALVRYRVHGRNLYYGVEEDPRRAYRRRLEAKRLTEHLRRRLSLPPSLIDIVHLEFRTIERPTEQEYRAYRGLVRRAVLPLWRKVWLGRRLLAHYRSQGGTGRRGRLLSDR